MTSSILRQAELYCLVIRHPFNTSQRTFITTLASDPILAVTCHNQQRADATDLVTSAPYNYIERAAGPFYSEERLKAFASELVRGTRGLPSLKKRIEVLAAQYGVRCYGADVQLEGGESAASYLSRRGAPLDYVEAVERLEKAGAVLMEMANSD
jgi:hypothetical protein